MKLCSIGLSQSRTVFVSGLPHNDAAVYTGTALRGIMAPYSGTAAVLLVVVFLFADRRVFKYVDWGLPLTFCMFFIFIGNKKGRYLAFYSAVNVLFLAVLLTLSWIIEPSF